MCGIVGVYGRDAGGRERDIAVMLAAVRSRGEMDEVQVTVRWSVATRRLRIVDRDRAIQPMAGESAEIEAPGQFPGSTRYPSWQRVAP